MKTSRRRLQQHNEMLLFIHRWRTKDPEKWMVTSVQGNSLEQSPCCYTPGDDCGRNTICLFIEPWIIVNIWLQIKLFPESLHFTWAFPSTKWSGHYQVKPLFSLLLSWLKVLWFPYLLKLTNMTITKLDRQKERLWRTALEEEPVLVVSFLADLHYCLLLLSRHNC